MPQVKVGDTLIADSDQTIIVEGNHYFPPDSIKKDYFKDSDTHTICGWKGVASYYDAEVEGKTISDVAWYYPEPKEKAANIKNYVAFYKNKVTIS
ncbi:hypothetical protein OPQ81_011347 [Rhizoctonia solani]|nr:hypothetical protein OPQ81_011347 [Rhizoctonia solani]